MKKNSKNILRRLLYRIYRYGERKFSNLEGLPEFSFTLPLSSSKKGIAAFIRVKNEEVRIVDCIKSIYAVFDQIVVIDNGSEDNTVSLVKDFISTIDADKKIKLVSYPFKVSRCGEEHAATNKNSVRSLSYYYNYSMSHCDLSYLCKWDADMIMTKKQRMIFIKLKEIILHGSPARYKVPGQTLYRSLRGAWYEGEGEIFFEPRIFPLSYFCMYRKGEYCERIRTPFGLEDCVDLLFYELKDASLDEFSHWSSLVFTSTCRRKQREYESISSLQKGIIPDNLIEVSVALSPELP